MQEKMRKIVVGTLFLIIVVGGSFTVVFADQDIGAMLTNWFDQKTDESIGEIEKVISQEQKKQTDRLKEELQLAIEAAEQDLNEFVQMEKNQRAEELKRYSDELIKEIDIDNDEIEQEILDEFDRILKHAKEEMEQILEEVEDNGGNSND
ncbi:hypothetical protein GMD78_04645 [Ornithinibacillus sp. L9]|uniref:Uncharacterized protein n=1 Tax=Ornithinibacillus caprae TaxID=2678566 RepID=A0A6N8FIU4_9BACI|nr:hypothetical protein [Ornithinibacillus caprae]MUK87689.1 hypothetical protein [Ornithinibacillus caprae]